jgi:hypothetical protein
MLVIAMPIAALLAIAGGSSGSAWGHLAGTVLPRATVTTLILMAGVGLGTAVIGVGTAWLVTMCRFPGRRVFEFALVLPLSVPVYIGAYCTVELLEFSGPLQTALRSIFGWRKRARLRFPGDPQPPGRDLRDDGCAVPLCVFDRAGAFPDPVGAHHRRVPHSWSFAGQAVLRIVLPMARPASPSA